MRIIPSGLTALLILAPLATAVSAQEQGLTLAQVERKYRQMNEVHILKCDYDGNEIFTRTEMLCVQSIYQALYLDRD